MKLDFNFISPGDKRTVRLRTILFWLHLAAGLTAGVVVLSMAASGTLLAFEPQIVEWAERGVRFVAPPADGAARLPLEDLAARAQASVPGARVSAVTVRSDRTASVAVGLGRENGTVYVDPYAGAVLGRG